MTDDFDWGFGLTEADLRFVDEFLERRNAIRKAEIPLSRLISRWNRFVAEIGTYLYEEYANECNGREILGSELIDVAPPRLRSAILEAVSGADEAYLQKTLPVRKPWWRVHDERYRWLYQRCPERWVWYREHGIPSR